MSVYVYNHFNITMPDGAKPWIMVADNEQELHEMAKKLDVTTFNGDGTNPFYIISKSKAKIARNLGAVYGDDVTKQFEFIKRVRKHFGIDND